MLRVQHAIRGLAAGIGIGLLLSAPAGAQRLDEPEATIPTAPSVRLTIAEPRDPAGADDFTPLGQTLQGLTFYRADVPPDLRPGIFFDDPSLREPPSTLSPNLVRFIGQDISLGLLAQIRAEVTRAYRDAGLPFVSVNVPPQEVESGLLTVQVIDFIRGDVTVTGNSTTPTTFAEFGLKTVEGEPLVASKLQEDLDWLDYNPFRSAQFIFSPGDGFGESDIEILVRDSDPQQFSLILSNDGQESSGTARLTANALFANVLVFDDILSVQGRTGLVSDVSVSNDIVRPDYLGASFLYDMPIAPARLRLQLASSIVDTRADIAPSLTSQSQTRKHEIKLLAPTRPTQELRVTYEAGLEYVKSSQVIEFARTPVTNNDYDIAHATAGVRLAHSSRQLEVNGAALFTRSLPQVGSINNTNALRRFTGSVNSDGTYHYVSLAGDVKLGIDLASEQLPEFFHSHEFSVSTNMQFTDDRLPPSERFQIGGIGSVRGYPASIATGDSGFSGTFEWALPANLVSREMLGIPDHSDTFYAFADMGGVTPGLEDFNLIFGTGAGLRYRISNWGFFDVAGGVALNSIGTTSRGDIQFHGNLQIGF